MQASKWIKDLTADTPVEDAAWRVLTIRFDAVRQAVDDALSDARDADAVHRLRVATRRAGAALWLFRDCVPDKALKKARSRLRKLRQAAGAVRDGDVQLARLRGLAKKLDKSDRPSIDFLIGYTLAQLAPANEELSAVAAKFRKRFDKVSARVIGSIKSPADGTTLAELARESLSSQRNKLAGALAAGSHELADLHQTRIIAKRLRYTIEIVGGCCPRDVRASAYSALVELQEILGDIHDHAVSADRLAILDKKLPRLLKKRARRYCPTLEGLIQRHESAIADSLPRFDDWRESWKARSDLLSRLDDREEAANERSEAPAVASETATN